MGLNWEVRDDVDVIVTERTDDIMDLEDFEAFQRHARAGKDIGDLVSVPINAQGKIEYSEALASDLRPSCIPEVRTYSCGAQRLGHGYMLSSIRSKASDRWADAAPGTPYHRVRINHSNWGSWDSRYYRRFKLKRKRRLQK